MTTRPGVAESATAPPALDNTALLALDNASPCLAAAWHPVAASAEVGDQPVGVLLLDRPWVLVRLHGEVRAFEDRCPHRLAPLSAGSVAGGRLVCRYHGWAFEAGGACTRIPANGEDGPIPSRASLARPAGVVERYGLVWLAPEPPVCDLHEFPEWDDPGFVRAATRKVSGMFRSVESALTSRSSSLGRRVNETPSGVLEFFASADTIEYFLSQTRVWPMMRRMSSDTLAIFAMLSTSASLIFGLLRTATATTLFGSRTRIARSSRVPFMARASRCAGDIAAIL